MRQPFPIEQPRAAKIRALVFPKRNARLRRCGVDQQRRCLFFGKRSEQTRIVIKPSRQKENALRPWRDVADQERIFALPKIERYLRARPGWFREMRFDDVRRFRKNQRLAKPEALRHSQQPFQKRNAEQLNERVRRFSQNEQLRARFHGAGEGREKVSLPRRLWLP